MDVHGLDSEMSLRVTSGGNGKRTLKWEVRRVYLYCISTVASNPLPVRVRPQNVLHIGKDSGPGAESG